MRVRVIRALRKIRRVLRKAGIRTFATDASIIMPAAETKNVREIPARTFVRETRVLRKASCAKATEATAIPVTDALITTAAQTERYVLRINAFARRDMKTTATEGVRVRIRARTYRAEQTNTVAKDSVIVSLITFGKTVNAGEVANHFTFIPKSRSEEYTALRFP